nr:unnamed protein product [Digitaria exilis]
MDHGSSCRHSRGHVCSLQVSKPISSWPRARSALHTEKTEEVVRQLWRVFVKPPAGDAPRRLAVAAQRRWKGTVGHLKGRRGLSVMIYHRVSPLLALGWFQPPSLADDMGMDDGAPSGLCWIWITQHHCTRSLHHQLPNRLSSISRTRVNQPLVYERARITRNKIKKIIAELGGR